MIGIYIHIPFCRRKCGYCNFYSLENSLDIKDQYVDALIDDIRSYKGRGIKADTLYFGGGTPSLLSVDDFDKIIAACMDSFTIKGEISTELNPCSSPKDYLKQLKQAGINRISFGVQSFNDNELAALSRLHNGSEAVKAVENGSAVGFDNISIDLMLATPFQTEESLKRSISIAARLPITHLSAYILKLEQGTPLFENEALRSEIPNDDISADLYLTAVSELEKHGLKQYEISNFARNGFECRHNLKYWQCEEYIGFGAAAHSFYKGTRYCNSDSIKDYIENKGCNPIYTDENSGDVNEKIMLGLRLNKGIPLSWILPKSEENLCDFLLKKAFIFSEGYAILINRNIALTPKGMLVSNSIIFELLNLLKYE